MKSPQETGRPQSASERGTLTSDLAARIRRAQEASQVAEEPRGAAASGNMQGLARGLRLGSEFVAAVLVGFGMGYLLDQWLQTSPWLMLIMGLMGFVSGVLNVVRTAAQMNKAALPPTGSARAPEQNDE